MLKKMPLQLRSFIISIFGGVLYALGFPNQFAPVLIVGPIFGLAILFWLLDIENTKNTSFKTRALYLFAFSLGHACFGFYWIPHTLQVFGQLPVIVSHLLGVAFALVILPQYWIFLLGLTWLNRRQHGLFNNHVISPTIRHLFFAITLTTLEYVVPQQFPAHPGHAWMEMAPHLSLAPIGGAPLFSFFSYWLAFCARQPLNQKQDWLGVVSGLCFVFLNTIIPLKVAPESETKLNIRIVQPNIGNFLKLDSESGGFDSIRTVFESYKELSVNGATKPDLIIWPETAFPHMLRGGMMKLHPKVTPRLFKEIIDETESELIIGGYDMNPESAGRFMGEYNAAFHFGKDYRLKNVYRKQLLIPFGEGLPFGPLNKPLSKVLSNVSFFAAGTEFTLFETDQGFKFSSIICYEALFSTFIREYLNTLRDQGDKPDFILNLTNDSWYGDTSEPYQHLFLAKWRAVEFALPMVRSTNTGVTSVIYEDGSESKQTGIFEKTTLELSLNKRISHITVFQKLGLAVVWIVWLVFTVIVLGIGKLTRKSLSNEIV